MKYSHHRDTDIHPLGIDDHHPEEEHDEDGDPSGDVPIGEAARRSLLGFASTEAIEETFLFLFRFQKLHVLGHHPTLRLNSRQGFDSTA